MISDSLDSKGHQQCNHVLYDKIKSSNRPVDMGQRLTCPPAVSADPVVLTICHTPTAIAPSTAMAEFVSQHDIVYEASSGLMHESQ